MMMYDVIRNGAESHPDRTAIIFRDEPISYGALGVAVNRLASALRNRGIGHGDRVAVLLGNCPQFTITYFATSALGAVCVPANPLLKPAELIHIWGDSDVKMVITAAPLLPNVLEAKAAVPSIRDVAAIGNDLPNGILAFDDLAAAGSDSPIEISDLDPNQAAVCIYTSGTTGRPKGALLSHNNLLANCRQIRQVLEFTENDNLLCPIPLFHSFACTVCQNAVLFCGARVTLLEQFNPAKVLESIERHRVTIFPGVPLMYGALLQFPADREYDFSSVRFCVSGGAPMPAPRMEAFERKFGTIILEGDGPTECSPVTSVNPPHGIRKPESIGLPLPGVEMKIFDDNDQELPIGEVGEIVVRGENVMLGYHNLPEETAEAMKSGWYHTGDLGKVDVDGYFYIVDRKKDMLLVGGLNVYPREVETVLYSHPAVQEAAVIGMPDPLKGDEVTAIVQLKQGSEATDRELIHFCRERLANYKIPRKVIFREQLPLAGPGKVLKRFLKKELELGSA